MSGFDTVPVMGNEGDIKTYTYYFNGLIFNSEIQLPEAPPYNGKASGNVVLIRYGRVPESVTGAYYDTPVLAISPDEVLVHIENAASYYIKGNNTIIIQPVPCAPENTVRLYIFSIVLGALLHRNDIFSLHASAIRWNDEAILISGNSGAGKSTLALGLYRKGYEILNDDISSIGFGDNETPFIYPGVVHLKLWARSLKKYGYESGNFNKLRDELEKYSFPLTRTSSPLLPVKAIFFISETSEPTQATAIEGLEKFQKLKANSYRYRLVQHMQKTTPHFLSATRLAGKVPLFMVKRNSEMPPADFASYMEEQFRKL